MSEQFKPFFVHYNRPVLKNDAAGWMHAPRGFTVYVEPTNEPRMINVQAVTCAALEKEFRKADGRKAVKARPVVKMNARELGPILEALRKKCDRVAPDYGCYNYIYKYMV